MCIWLPLAEPLSCVDRGCGNRWRRTIARKRAGIVAGTGQWSPPDSVIQLWVTTALGHCKAAWNEDVLPDRLGAARTERTVLGPRQKKVPGKEMRVCRILHTRETLGVSPPPPYPLKGLLGAGSAKSQILIHVAQSLRGKILMSKNLATKLFCSFSPTERFGCTMISGFTNERKVGCHNEAVEKFGAPGSSVGS